MILPRSHLGGCGQKLMLAFGATLFAMLILALASTRWASYFQLAKHTHTG